MVLFFSLAIINVDPSVPNLVTWCSTFISCLLCWQLSYNSVVKKTLYICTVYRHAHSIAVYCNTLYCCHCIVIFIVFSDSCLYYKWIYFFFLLQLYNYFEDSNYVYLVLEMCHNGEMSRFLKERKMPFSEEDGKAVGFCTKYFAVTSLLSLYSD